VTTPVVLLHGLGGSPAVWRHVVPLLGSMPIHAPLLTRPARIEDDADAVAVTLTAAGPAVVVGHSRGGLVATALAERHPHLVSHVVVVNSPPTTAARAGTTGERALGLPLVGALLWRAMPRSAATRGLATAFAPGTDVPPVFVDDLRATGHAAFVAASSAIDRYLDDASLPGRLVGLAHGADVVLGTQDLRLDLSAYDAEPSLRLTTLDAVGHTPPWEAPDATASVITRALSEGGQTR